MAHQRVLLRSEAGIVDSTRAIRIALGNAVPVSGVRLLTKATTIAELPAPKGEGAGPPEAP